MNKKELEKEINYLINPEDQLLECKINYTKTLKAEWFWAFEISASIVDRIGNVYASFSISSLLGLNLLDREEEMVKEMYKDLKNNILKWTAFGKTNPTSLSLIDAINCAKVLIYNRK